VIHSYYLAPEGTLQKDPDRAAMKRIVQERKGVLWVDIEAPTPEEASILGPEVFDFHPLAVEDCLHAQSRPKLDDYDEYLYLVFHAWKRDGDRTCTEEVDFFLGKNYVVSHHMEPRTSRSVLAGKCEVDARLVLGHGADMLLHQILDLMVDKYKLVVDSLDERVDALEFEILESASEATLKKILVLKRDLQELFRMIRHQRDVMSSLCREGHPNLSKKARTFMRDVYDHVVRVHDTVEGLRDEVAGARDAYLAIVSNRVNAVMKALTIVSTLALPVLLVSGVFGMNFSAMPLIHEPWAFWFSCVAMILVGAVMFIWFRAKRWV
jgi:magnesium transporter